MATSERTDGDLLRATVAKLAPGTQLRDGLERILRGHTGALIVLGCDKTVESLCSGGFPLDVDLAATRLRELAKMDGAIILDDTLTRIVWAATQLVPDPSITTDESGTRHRTAEDVLADFDQLSSVDLLDLATVAKVCGYGAAPDALDTPVSPRGYRLLARVPRLPRLVVDRLVEHFGSLQKLLAAGIDDLQAVEGVGETRARSVREGLSRLAESSILERYV